MAGVCLVHFGLFGPLFGSDLRQFLRFCLELVGCTWGIVIALSLRGDDGQIWLVLSEE